MPRGARIAVAHSLKSVIDRLLNENSAASWEDLLLYPYAVLAVPESCDEVRNLTTWVKQNVRDWEDDPVAAVPLPRIRKTGKPGADPFNAKKVEAKLADGDIRGALRLLESDDSVAPYDDATRTALLMKHPPHPEPAEYPVPLEPAPVIVPVTAAELQHGVKTFAPGSAGGSR